MKYIIALIIGLLFFSCATDVCNQKSTWPVQASFYKISSLNKDSLVFMDGLTLKGENNDSSLYSNENKNKVEFPLTAPAGSSTYIFKIQSLSDTVTIYHSNTLYLISKQCGYGYQQVIDSVVYTQNVLNKITWKVPQVDKNDKENIQIYY
jgi:hypothetical protein